MSHSTRPGPRAPAGRLVAIASALVGILRGQSALLTLALGSTASGCVSAVS